ncbi:MAG: 4Fe-4S dicluster domain-containing protein, partial [Desulfobacterales bacterium]|nr:4Fe-4S dicluster domain-containing protein [Desulfobacterales bacterium]
DFVRYVDETNLDEKQYNQERIIHSIVEYLDTAKPMADPEWLTKKVGQAKDLAYSIRKKLTMASRDALEAEIHSKNFYTQVRESLRGYSLIQENLDRIYDTTRKRLIVIATHMHAGDGNVHVNIPVLSNDREMMERANMTADKVMEKTVELGGVVSGEHGIGVTKIKHLSEERRREFDVYRDRRDPDRVMNPDKLSDPHVMDKVFTPSFNLLELEARILKHGSLSDLALKVANCVRCGKCKPQCPVFYPEKNMFFHPRNKNLAIGSLIEALLYISQRTQSTAFKILKNLAEIADHCTICHKCLDKCPVNIDSGQISIEERQILKTAQFKKTPLSTQTTLKYLGSKNPGVNKAMRTGLLGVGATLQRAGSTVLGPLARTQALTNTRWAQLLRSPVSRAAAKTLRGYLPKTRKNQALVLDPPEGEARSTVFYFPGCGSERIFSRISMASIFLLLNKGHRVILPPPFLCCGYPLKVNAQKEVYDRVSLENIIIFTQIRDYFHDLEFDACIVSCGTCMESLARMEIEDVFGCDVQDISQYLLSRHGLPEMGEQEGALLYHAPCHDSLKAQAVPLLDQQGVALEPVPFCCSEAGTLAISRPDISHNMLMRKKEAIREGKEKIDGPEKRGKAKILTNCPSCIQGLGRHARLGVKPVHMAEELACRFGGADWKAQFKQMVKDAQPVRF